MNLVRTYNRCACLLCGLSITSYVMATFYTFQPSLLIALCGLPAVMLAWWFSSRQRLLLPRWAVNSLLLLAVVYAAYRAAQGVKVEVIAELVVFIQIIKLGDRRSPRDDAQVLSLAVFLAIAAVLTSNGLWVGVQLVAFIPLLIATVMLYQLYAGWFAAGRLSSPMVSARVPFRSIVGFATAGTIGLSLFVFIIMPRGVGENMLGNWHEQQGASRTGFTDHVMLGSSDIISTSPRIVLDMSVREANPGDDEGGANMGGPDLVYYLRGAMLDDYEPRTGVWKAGAGHRITKPDLRDSEYKVVVDPGAIRLNVRQDISIHSIDGSKAAIFCLWRPGQVHVGRRTREAEVDADARTVRRSGQSGPFDYTVWSSVSQPPGESTGARTPVSFDSAPVRALTVRVLTTAGVDPDPATRAVEDDGRAARTIQDYLQKNFSYTLVEQGTPEGQDPIEHFLFDTLEGNCEYFAGAMVLMCRSVGINAWMVAGYVAAEFNESTGRYVVRESNAHAWVEAETGGIGAGFWRRFDPTPPADLARLHKPRAGFMASLRRALESVEYAWNSGVVGFDQGAQQRLFGRSDEQRSGVLGLVDGLARRVQSARFRTVLAALGTGLGVFLGIAGAGFLLQWMGPRLSPLFRFRRAAPIPVQSGLSPERQAQTRFYAKLLAVLRARGTPKPAWLPPLAHSAAIRARSVGDASCVARLAWLYYAATFGDRPLSRAELSEADETLDKLVMRNR